MKKFKKIYLSILFSALMAFGGVMLSLPQKNVALANFQTLPANATFMKYTKVAEDDFVAINQSNILHQDAVFLTLNQVVIFELGNPEAFPQDFISDVVIDVYLNSNSLGSGSAVIEESANPEGSHLPPIQWVKMILDPYASNPSGEGKYDINIEYFDKNVVKQTISFTFYLYKQSTYFTSNLPAVSVQNVNRTTPAMDGSSFARTHEFHYANDFTSAQSLSLPTITFDSSKFEVTILKNHSGFTQTTNISVDLNGNVVQTLPIVMAKKDGNNVVVTFNDIGAYTVNYFMLYKSGNEKFLFGNINNSLRPDRLQVYGFQAYHSNINATSTQDQQKEFKVILPNHTIDQNYQTDITFTQIQNRFINSVRSQAGAKLYTPVTGGFTLTNIDSRAVFNGNNLSAKSTNQAPVSFKYNASLITNSNISAGSSQEREERKSFYFKLSANKTELGENIWQKFDYDGTAFSDVGTYLVKLSYTSDLSVTPSSEYTQWFYFTISNQIPSHSVKANGQELSTGSFTKEVVEVSFNQAYNPFDSASKLSVYRRDTLAETPVLVKEVAYNHVETFSQNGIYTVELARGRNFTSKNTSQFVIDTTPITGLLARDVKVVNNSFVKANASGFFTNQSVAVEWNNKTANNNTVSAFYKYIPLVQINPFTATEYNDYLGEQAIPVPYALDYTAGNNLSTIPYANTLNLNNLNNANIFSQEGLYMIRAVDKAGNEAFTYFFIDKTTPTILQKDLSGNFLSDYSKLNIVSEVVTIQWGNYKAIKTFLDLENINFTTWLTPQQETTGTNLDSWLFRMLKEKANNNTLYSPDGDFKVITSGGRRVLALTPRIAADNIKLSVGGSAPITLASNTSYTGFETVGNHSVIIYPTRMENGNLVGIETSYNFEINDESNKNTIPSARYSISTSTDVSKTAIKFKGQEAGQGNFAYETLTNHNYLVTNRDDSVLMSYFMPINTKELQLQFLTTTDESSIEIERVVAYFYPYISNYLIYTGTNPMLNKGAPTFYTLEEEILYTGATQNGLIQNQHYTLQHLIDNNVFSLSNFIAGRSLTLAKTPVEIEIYNYNTNTNLARLENAGENLWVWDIQLEEFYDSNNIQTQTMAGKYEIVRTYRQSEGLSNTLSNKADFITRHLTFILEREDVISKGQDTIINGQNSTFSLVGGSAYIEILAGSNNPANKFTSLYTARTYSPEQQQVLLETNKLPVKLGFPVAKFGQVIGNEFSLLANNYFYANTAAAYINSFEMGVRVTHLATGKVVASNLEITVSSTQPASNQTYVRLDNNLYLIFKGAVGGYLVLEENFTQEGKYQVDFFQKNTAIKGLTSSMSLFFQITNIAPDFSIVNEYGISLPKHDTQDIFYANQNQVTVTWTDSSNPYYAKINKNEIYYIVNNGIPVKVTQIATASDEITHSFVVPTTVEGASIVVRMQYEGNQSDYASGAFSKSKTIIVDKTAPTLSINNLIQRMDDASLFNAVSLRQGHNQAVRFNRTITTGNLAEFSFAVDKSNIQNIILNSLNGETFALYYRVVEKYSNPSVKEFDPTQSDALLQLESGAFTRYTASSANFNANTYYEFVEADKAGNLTVYTIFLTDVQTQVAEENALKANDVNYKDFLSDDFKVINYSSYKDTSQQDENILNRFESVLSIFEANNNIKVYSKQFFNLNSINPYGYEWYLLTFGSNKYLASPFLNGQVFRVSGGAWTAVSLEDVIYLTVSRNNYVFEIKNISTNKLVFNVVVSNAQLSFQTPQANNPTLTVISNRANDTEFVNWQTVSIWEYQNGVNSAFAMFVPTQTEPVVRTPEDAGFNLATYTVSGLSTMFSITTKNQSYYRFKIVDNFGLEYVMYHLAGTQFIEQIEELEGRTLVSDNTIDNTNYYISNQGFKFTYYPALTQSVTIKIGVLNPETLEVETQTHTLTGASSTINSEYASIANFTNYRTITLKPSFAHLSQNFKGTMVTYEVTTATLAPTAEQPNHKEEETKNFKVYSIVPKTVLTGKNKQDLSDILLRNEQIISEPITIEFKETAQFNYPVKVYISFNNQTPVLLASGQTFSLPGTYTITKVYSNLMEAFAIANESFVISDQASVYFNVVQFNQALGKYVNVEVSPVPYKLEIPLQFEQTTVTQHYIVNTTDWKINPNASQFMEVVDNEGIFANYNEVRKNGVSTFIKTISNHHVSMENKSFNYHKTTIAVTYIPQNNKIVRDFYFLDSEANRNNLFATYSEKTYALIKDQDQSNQVEILWNNYHLIPENKITATIYYGQDKQQLSSNIVKTNGTSDYVILTRSGNYSFVFSDQAGNVHKFDYNSQITESSSAYEFVFLNSVIFTVNDQAPIQRAIYNNEVKITLPSYTMSYYDNNARPVILVTRNLEVVTDYTYQQSTRTYTFTKPGLYTVVFSAKIGTKEIKQEPFIFEIIKEKELSWMFNVERFGNYYIEKIEKNNVDVTQTLSNASLGSIITIQQNGQTLTRLRNILISLHDEQTGAGVWTITVNTNNDLEQKFAFTFTISDSNPPIVTSHELGARTTDVITVSFNVRNLYESVGEAILKIGSREIHLNDEYFNGDIPETQSFNITAIGDTYVQIFTPSGRLMYTYRVTRTQPLNSVAIIIIVVTSIASTGLIVMFVLLRKRMKIR